MEESSTNYVSSLYISSRISVTPFRIPPKQAYRPRPNSDWADLGLKIFVWKIVTTFVTARSPYNVIFEGQTGNLRKKFSDRFQESPNLTPTSTTRKTLIGGLVFCGAPLIGAPQKYFCGAWEEVRHRNIGLSVAHLVAMRHRKLVFCGAWTTMRHRKSDFCGACVSMRHRNPVGPTCNHWA